MTDTKRLNVSDIDFESIQNNLKEFLRSQDTLRDYDFEGSALSSIINLLSYVTHYNAVNANLGLNETFLDTAQFRGSVVGHARQLGYTPNSPSAPTAFVDVTVNNSPSGEALVIRRGHQFKTKINNITYNFITDAEYRSNTGFFEDVKIVQGQLQTAEYIFDVDSSEKFLIPDRDVDISTVLVRVYDEVNSGTFTVFNAAKELTSITNESRIYYLHENPDGYYEITFGDGVLGQQLENGNVIEIEFLVTNKAESNGASVFSIVDSISGFSDINITTTSAARGGAERESNDSIRYLAPLSYAAQNRAVTPRDYEVLISEAYENIESIKVWGGEDNDPPVYGKVFISINPKNSEALTDDQKDFIVDKIVKPKNVTTITPEILDPEFLYISFEAFFKYDPSLTNMSKSQLENAVTDSLRNYNDTELNQFDSVFRYSKVLNAIDKTDESILNSFLRVYISKRFIPTFFANRTYTLNYSVDLFESFGTRPVIRSSSLFTVNGIENCRFTDVPASDGTREVIVVTGPEDNQTVVKRNVGTIEGNKIILTDFRPTDYEGSFVSIEAIPNSYDIASTFNTILTIDCECQRYIVEGAVDTIVTGEDSSGSDYQTTPKNA